MSKNPESLPASPDREYQPPSLAETDAPSKERSLDKAAEAEAKPDNNQEQAAEQARHEALQQADTAEKEASSAEKPTPAAETYTAQSDRKNQAKANFRATMKQAQDDMSPLGRNFSKFIHLPAVEKVSDFTAKTVARPNAILSGAIFAFAATLAIYLLAKNYGYTLSGFETMAAFILGWVIGLLYDFFKVMITGRKDG